MSWQTFGMPQYQIDSEPEPSFDERDLLPASDYFEKLNTDEWPFIQPPPKKETP
jgi:hypothetical protein